MRGESIQVRLWRTRMLSSTPGRKKCLSTLRLGDFENILCNCNR